MSNIAGKAYAMNLVTPVRTPLSLFNRLIFKAVGTRFFKSHLNGLLTLSMIHYARWVMLRAKDLPRLSDSQPKETFRYTYMLFFSNFNGSWEQYVDSFSAAIPSGLNLLWWKNVGWPTSVPEQPFHRYVEFNQVWTDYYYSAYPMAASNDVKAAQRVQQGLVKFVDATAGATPEQFLQQYNQLIKTLQSDLSQMCPTPIVSLAAEEISARRRGVTAKQSRAQNDREVARLIKNSDMPIANENAVAIEERSSAE
ncbi:MAG: hypothetical protein JWN04_1652 [Myxococcaceae bacterium]|nr:hypothetical protein [Myxococcaceae bacterium]